MQWDFQHATRIKAQSCLLTTFGCGRKSKFKRMLAKAESSITKELDIVKFLQRQRLQSYMALAILNGRQQYLADKMATMLIRESSDFDESTDDDFELARENVLDITGHGKKIFNSANEVDRRLVRAYEVKRWADDYKRHKGKVGPYKELEVERVRGLDEEEEEKSRNASARSQKLMESDR
mmetsp:Transcript_15901/g.20065  ORF Transcript_15901/g.20065 Transcript_15901/m.20065 type:complete len:180 (+) Transcript_15901:1292-1831(+)